jgi:hypothetical protein
MRGRRLESVCSLEQLVCDVSMRAIWKQWPDIVFGCEAAQVDE